MDQKQLERDVVRYDALYRYAKALYESDEVKALCAGWPERKGYDITPILDELRTLLAGQWHENWVAWKKLKGDPDVQRIMAANGGEDDQ